MTTAQTAPKQTTVTSTEKQAILSIASIFALRMLGLFMLVPILSLYVQKLPGATPLLIGIAIGCYGLTQALLQIPLGVCSDYYGRKPIITIGLLIIAAGSALAALSHTILGVILGRSLQGAGAIGSASSALLADLTQEKNRTIAMAAIGITIGGAFTFAMILGPLLTRWLSIPGIFWITFIFAIAALFILKRWAPSPDVKLSTTNNISTREKLKLLITNQRLLRLNVGILILHAILSANFIIVPIYLQQNIGILASQQWQVYAPSLLLACLIIIPLIRFAKNDDKDAKVFSLAILLLIFSELSLAFFQHTQLQMTLDLTLFFTAFTLLETFIPSAVSKVVSMPNRGAAMSINSSYQFLGIFLGGIVGGYLYQHFNLNIIFFSCAVLSGVWFLVDIFTVQE